MRGPCGGQRDSRLDTAGGPAAIRGALAAVAVAVVVVVVVMGGWAAAVVEVVVMCVPVCGVGVGWGGRVAGGERVHG